MSTILAKVDKENNKILIELIKKLGGNVVEVNDNIVEDILLGSMMDSSKTGITVSKTRILKKLKKK